MWIMALLQTDHENAAYLMGSSRSPARPAAERFAHVADHLFAPMGAVLGGLRRWSMRRALRKWRNAAERARQRRALARLSDRELKDIGITRYDVEFVLRQSRWR
jgi:uncharacterized protein YjiS (DUF1127 family)